MVFSTKRLSLGIRRKKKIAWIKNPKRHTAHSFQEMRLLHPWVVPFFWFNSFFSCFPEPQCKQNSLTKKCVCTAKKKKKKTKKTEKNRKTSFKDFLKDFLSGFSCSHPITSYLFWYFLFHGPCKSPQPNSAQSLMWP